MELQADCFAGFGHVRLHESRQILEAGDIEEALNAASQIGMIASRRGLRVRWSLTLLPMGALLSVYVGSSLDSRTEILRPATLSIRIDCEALCLINILFRERPSLKWISQDDLALPGFIPGSLCCNITEGGKS